MAKPFLVSPETVVAHCTGDAGLPPPPGGSSVPDGVSGDGSDNEEREEDELSPSPARNIGKRDVLPSTSTQVPTGLVRNGAEGTKCRKEKEVKRTNASNVERKNANVVRNEDQQQRTGHKHPGHLPSSIPKWSSVADRKQPMEGMRESIEVDVAAELGVNGCERDNHRKEGNGTSELSQGPLELRLDLAEGAELKLEADWFVQNRYCKYCYHIPNNPTGSPPEFCLRCSRLL